METRVENKGKMTFIQKINYCAASIGMGLMTGIVTGFALIFMTDTVGLNSGIVATLISAAMMILVFCVPNAAEAVQYVYFFIFYVLMNAVCRTVSGISYDTMSIRITNVPAERVSIGAIKSVMGTLLGLVQTSFTLSLCTALGGGIRGWRAVAAIFAAIGGLLMLYSGLTTKELPAEELDDAEPEVKETRGFFKEMAANYKTLFTSKYAVMMVILAMSTVLMTGAAATVASYFAVWVLGDENMMLTVTVCMMLPMVLSYFVTPALVKKFGLYTSNWVTMFIGFIFAVISVIFGYTGLTIPMFAAIALRGLFAGLYGATQNALVAEIGEYTYVKDGVHIEGVVFGCVSFGNKIGGSIIIAACGWLLAAAGYNGTAATQTPAALSMITFLFVGVPAIFIGMDALILKNMKVTQKKEVLLKDRGTEVNKEQ